MQIVVLVTAKDKHEARRIGRYLVREKLAACVNILGSVNSLFWWKNKIDKADEALLIIKTQKACFRRLEKAVKFIHSYDLPEIIAIPIIIGNKKYLEWIKQSTSK